MKLEQATSEIKRRLKITEVIGRSVRLKKRGANWIGLCPFHREKTPSFNVHEDEGYFKCFGCGAGGDIFTFLEKKTGQLFIDVLRQLAAECGVTLDDGVNGPAVSPDELKHTQKKKKLLNDVQRFFAEGLFAPGAGKEALDYLLGPRKLSIEQVKRYGFGFAGTRDDDVLKHLAKTGAELGDADSLGIVRLQENGPPVSVFKGRITIPIRSQNGEVVAFGGRIFRPGDERAKYINSRANDLYQKKAVFFGLFESLPLLRQGLPGVIVEGYFDAVAVLESGFPALAPCGTALTREQLTLLKRYTERLVLCFDKDSAGRAAFLKSLLMALELGFLLQSVNLGQAKDPDDLRQRAGGERLKQCISDAKDAVEVLIHRVAELASAGLKERIRGIRFLLPFLGAHPSPLVKNQYFRMAALSLKEDEKALIREYEQLKAAPKKGAPRVLDAPIAGRPTAPSLKSETPKSRPLSLSHNMLLTAVLRTPHLINQLTPELLNALPGTLSSLFFQLAALLAKNVELTVQTLADQLYLPNDPVFISTFVHAAKAAEKLNYQEAEQMVNGYVAIENKKKEKAELLHAQEKMQRLSKDGEFAKAKALLMSQTESLRQKRPKAKEVEHSAKAISLLAPPTTRDYTMPTDLPEDDGGWL